MPDAQAVAQPRRVLSDTPVWQCLHCDWLMHDPLKTTCRNWWCQEPRPTLTTTATTAANNTAAATTATTADTVQKINSAWGNRSAIPASTVTIKTLEARSSGLAAHIADEGNDINDGASATTEIVGDVDEEALEAS